MTKEVIWILWICLGMAAILLFFYVYLVIQKFFEIGNQNKMKKRRKFLEPLLVDYLQYGKVTRGIEHIQKIDVQVIKEILRNYNQNFGGEEYQKRIREFAIDKLTVPFQKTLRSRRFAVRMNTLYSIEEFKMDNLLSLLKEKLKNKRLDKAERFQIYRILAVLDDSDLFHYLVEQSNEYFPDYLFRELLLKTGEESFFDYVNNLQSLHLNLSYAVIDIIGIKGDLRHMLVLEQIVNSEIKELRIRAMKALSRIGYVQNKENILAKVASESWEERMMAARVMGIVKWEGFLPSLQEMMKDSSWWVRTISAQSILRYTTGKNLLQEIAENDNDRYARDMAKEWLEAI